MTTRETNPTSESAGSIPVAERVMERVAETVDVGLPLAGGLRAAAAESVSRSVSKGLLRLAARIERGEPLDRALAAEPHVLPEAMRLVVSASATQGRLHESLAQWCEQQRGQAELTRGIWSALLYPLVVISLSLAVNLLVLVVTSRTFTPLVEEFALNVKLGNANRVAMWLGGPGLGVVVLIPFTALLAWAVLRYGLGREVWNMMISNIPLVGPIWYWMAVARWSRWTALLLESRIPLPQSLELAAATALDRRVANESRRLAQATSGGQSFSRSLADSRVLPGIAAVLVRWGEQSATVVRSCRDLAELCELRARTRARWLRLACPPLAFVFVVFTVVFSYTNFVMPMTGLIRALMM